MKYYLLFLAILFASCKADYHVRRMHYHRVQAEAKGAEVKETVISTSMSIPGVSNSFSFDMPESQKEYVFLTSDSIQIKIKRVPVDTAGMAQSIRERLEGQIDCPPTEKESEIIYRDVPCPKCKEGWKWWQIVLAIAGAALVGGGLVRLFGK